MPILDVTGIETQNREDMRQFQLNPPAIDIAVELNQGDTVNVRGVNVQGTLSGNYEFDLDGGAGWSNTDGVFTGLGAGDHTFQVRDTDTPATLSQTITLAVAG